jgi:6-pyruvoyltetrahydropterin/6-carboxytetrahydropterin synthase
MYKIKTVVSFSAAHYLREYKGKCESLHGHNWRVVVVVEAGDLDVLGMVMDFSDLKKATHAVLETLDHKNLNDVEYFKKVNPSSENIARYIYLQLKTQLQQYNCRLHEVGVWETDTSCAVYSE